MTFVACPSCGRADVDLVGLRKPWKKDRMPYSNLNIHVAVMGCEVNGPAKRAPPISASPAARASV